MAAIEERTEELVDGQDVIASGVEANVFKLKAAMKDAGNRAKTIKATKYGPPEKEAAPEGLPALMQKNLIQEAIERERV